MNNYIFAICQSNKNKLHKLTASSYEEAVEKAKEYITKAIEHSFSLGKGVGPTNHFFNLKNN